MPDVDREKKIAAAKQKLRKFKKKRELDGKVLKDDTSSLASEDIIDENVAGDSLHIPDIDKSVQENEKLDIHQGNELEMSTKLNVDINRRDNNPSIFNEEQISFSPVALKTDSVNGNKSESNVTVSEPNDTDVPSSNNDLISFESDTTEETSKTKSLSTYTSDPTDASLENSSTMSVISSTDGDLSNQKQHVEDNFISISEHSESLVLDETPTSSASTEKLLQISTKLNGLAAEAQSVTSNGTHAVLNEADKYVVNELENRNLQLADQVATLTRQKQDLLLQVDQLTQQMSSLHHRLEAEKQQIYSHGVNEQNTLRQQLQVQMQTISILVAEKQELQHQIHESRSSMTQEHNSRQKFQDQLQDAKLNIQKLEREIQSSNDSVASLKAIKSSLTEERDHLQTSLNKVTKSNDENNMHANELNKKLTIKEGECKRLSLEIDDLHEKLSMAEVLLQQLNNSSNVSTETQLQQIKEERDSLNQKLIEYQQAFEQMAGEREQFSRQYEDMNAAMKQQVSELSEQVALLESEKCDLEMELEEVQRSSKLIEDKLQNQSETNQEEQPKTDERIELAARLEEVTRQLETAIADRNDVRDKLNNQLMNNERLAKLNEEQESQLNELKRNILESDLSADEHAKLLDQSQNDKATISRALSQNKQLKQQLEEMHEGFIKLSNDKMELASKLASTEHLKKELEDEVENLKVTLSEIEEKLSAKEADVDHLQQVFTQSQLSSNQFEEKQDDNDIAMNNLKAELASSQETVNILGEQNNQLKSMIIELQTSLDQSQRRLVSAEEKKELKENKEDDGEESEEDETVSSSGSEDENTIAMLSASLQQLEEEKQDIANKLEEEQKRSYALTEQLLHLEESRDPTNEVSVEKHKQLLNDMSLLQERFCTIMKERVEALNKVEELEHVNLQLQNECDTIGEYITLYQNQRQVLKQRHHEKDEYVSAMAQEREMLQSKMNKLQSLVMSLVKEKTPPDLDSLPLTSSPIKDRTSDEDNTTITNLNLPSEWPDMLEDEEGRPTQGSRPDLLPDLATLPPTITNETKSPPDRTHNLPGKSERIDSQTSDTSTASEIINLLEQIQHPSRSNVNDKPRGFCLRYMGPYTAI